MDTDDTTLRERLSAILSGGYVLERELRGGGMSRVFVAHDARLGRRVVVKVLHRDLAAGLSAERFAREVKLAARLQHPHVVPLLTAGDLDGLSYYTMPYVEGESLRTKLAREGRLPIPDAVRLLREVADALAYAHGQGVIHRDLKPDNVLLSGGHAVIADFGVAKALVSATHDAGASTAGGTCTAVGTAVGTPAYMAPEQIAADPMVDGRADLYALGAVAYELLTGEPPFAGRPVPALLAAHLTEVPVPIAQRRPDAPPMLGTLVMSLLAKKPADRPPTAVEVVRSLDGLMTAADRSVVASRPSRTRRNRLLRAAVLFGVGASAVGAAAVWGPRLRPSQRVDQRAPGLVANRVAVTPFENRTGSTALAPVSRLTSDWITQGLAEAGFAEVADPLSVQIAHGSTRGTRELGAAVGARLIIAGSYYLDSDSIRFLARIIDAERDEVLSTVGPVSAQATSPRVGVAAVRERVLAATASLLDVRTETWAVATGLPPTLAAYQHWSAGLEHFFRNEFAEAAPEFRAATLLDSTFVAPLVFAVAAYMNSGSLATADSLLRVAERSRHRLSPSNRYLLEVQRAQIRGDWTAAMHAGREMVRAAPGSDQAHVVFAWDAWRSNHPRAAIAALARIDPDRIIIRGYAPYWDLLTQSQHLAGEYQAELEAARRGRVQFPGRLTTLVNEARALAALGRASDIMARLDEARDLPADALYTPGEAMREIGDELRAHGQAGASDTAFARALRWYEGRPPGERAAAAGRDRLAATLYAAGRWEEARRHFERLAAERPGELDYRGYLGALAARRGDRRAALLADSALATLGGEYLLGRHTYWRARIAALLGEPERAVMLLRGALEQGREYRIVHAERDLEALRDTPAFRELTRIKG